MATSRFNPRDLVQARRNGWELLGHDGNTRAPINRETYRVRDPAARRAEPLAAPPWPVS